MNGMILCKKESTKQKTKEIKKMKEIFFYIRAIFYTILTIIGLTGITVLLSYIMVYLIENILF